MPRAKKLTVAEAIATAAMIELNLSAFEETAPQTVAAMGGREALARISQMCCFGPVPKLDVETWQRMSDEYEERRNHGDLADSHRALYQRPRRGK
jgi:hypothetical protein